MMKYAISIILCCFVLVSCDEVPVALWNIKGDSLQLKPVSALGNDDNIFVGSLGDALQAGANVLVFSVNKVSLEDFSSNDATTNSNSTLNNMKTFLDTQPYMFLPSVKDSLSHVHKMHCGVQEIIVDQVVDENILRSVSDAFEKSCIVILHISDFGITKTKDPKSEELSKVFMPSLSKSSKKNIVGLFTSVKSSWSNSMDNHHAFRHLLAVEEPDPYFINITGCLIAYAKNGTLSMPKQNVSTTLTFPVDTTGSSCGGNASSLLQLNFKLSGDVTNVVVVFNFSKKKNSWVTDTTIEISGPKVPTDIISLNSDDVTAATGFSFSCGKLDLVYGNKTNPVTLTINTFQVEPFAVNEKFSDSFDCVTFFTIAIWMGIFVSLIFIVIINCGIYALFSVHTMDRFDDPKGKSITVAAASD